MLVELVVRFLLGGAIVSVFSVVGDVFKPKTFAGLFGAAPSVALTTLALTYARDGAGEVSTLGQSMVIGGVGFYVYGAACATLTKREHWPEWIIAGSSWLAWFTVAFGLWGAGRAAGVLQ